jgi:hypothetical protein
VDVSSIRILHWTLSHVLVNQEAGIYGISAGTGGSHGRNHFSEGAGALSATLTGNIAICVQQEQQR